MSHEIWNDQVFSVRSPMWHGLGTVLQDYPGREEAMRLAGHDFTVIEEPFYRVQGDQAVLVPGWKTLIHSKEDRVIHCVKDTYEVIQNDQMWDILDTILDTPKVNYETGGTLKEGAVLWVMARLDEPIQIKGDDSPTYPFITVSTAHDQSAACRAMANAIRVVCWNTFSSADAKAKEDGLYFTFRHTKNVKDKIAFAQEALGMVRGQFKRYHELADTLAARPMTFSSIKDFISDFIPMPPDSMITDRVKTNILVARAQVLNILNDQPTISEANRRTAYGVWSSCIEYLDHYRDFRSKETYFKRSIMDPGTVKLSLANKLMEVTV